MVDNTTQAKQHIAKLIFDVSGMVVPAEDILFEIKPYAKDAGTYLEVSVAEQWKFTKRHRSDIVASIMLGAKLTTNEESGPGDPLKFRISPPYAEPPHKFDGNAAIAVLAASSIQAYEWHEAGMGYRPRQSGMIRG